MSELSMSKQERDDFLAALHVGILAVEPRRPAAGRRAYVDSGASNDDIVVRLHPTTWRTSDYSRLDNPGG